MAQSEAFETRCHQTLAALARLLLRELLRYRRLDPERSRFRSHARARSPSRPHRLVSRKFSRLGFPDIIEYGEKLAIERASDLHPGRGRGSRRGRMLPQSAC